MHFLESSFITLLAAAFVLGVLILAHEWGHFVVAKFCGVRVNVFSFGYGPRLWGWKRGDTDYRISALPFGGYVRMAGDNPSEERSGAADEFLSRPRWQRFLIAVAGPSMNFLLSFLILTGLFLVGVPEPAFISQPATVAGVLEGSPAAAAGIQGGDRIVKINDQNIARWEDVPAALAAVEQEKSFPVEVERGGHVVQMTVNSSSQRSGRDDFGLLGFPYETVIIDSVNPGAPAEKAGLKLGDQVLKLEGQTLLNYAQLYSKIRESDGKPIHLEVRRQGQVVPIVVEPKFGDPGDGVARWQIGITSRPQTIRQSYGLPTAVSRSVSLNVVIARQIFDVLIGLFDGRFKLKQLMGPVGIVHESGEAARRGISDLLLWMAGISVNLGILNLLPIPILDGGHVLLLAIEGAIRRELSLAVKERFVQVGLVFLLAIFAFVMYYDVLRLWLGR